MNKLSSVRPIPKVFLFDLGNVVFNVHFDRALEHWQKVSNKNVSALFELDEYYERFEIGAITIKEYCQHLRRILHLNADDQYIIDGWNRIFGQEMHGAVQAIKRVSQHYDCYALTNTNATHQAVWQPLYATSLALFKQIFISSELGLRKPSSDIYHYVCRALSIKPENMLFFDDREENITTASELGFHTVLVQSEQDVVRALRTY